MTRKLKTFLCLFFFSIVSNVIGQVDSNYITNKDIQKEAIQIREKINNFMNEKLLINDIQKPNENKLVSQEEKLIQMQNGLDSILSIVSHQNNQMDSMIINLKLLEGYLGLNATLNKKNRHSINDNEVDLLSEIQKNNINVITLNAAQFYKFKSIDSVFVLFDKNAIKLNYNAMLSLDSILPFMLDNNILLIGYYFKKEINNDYAVKKRVNDIKLYLVSKGIKPSKISTQFIKEIDNQTNNLTNKVNVIFGK